MSSSVLNERNLKNIVPLYKKYTELGEEKFKNTYSAFIPEYGEDQFYDPTAEAVFFKSRRG